MTNPLPNHLWQAAFNVNFYSLPLHDTPQAATKLQLFDALTANDARQVLDALHAVARELQRDIAGHYMPECLGKTVRSARALIAELETVVGAERVA
jgi:hypothetical protein